MLNGDEAGGKAPGFEDRPNYHVLIEPTEKWVRAEIGGEMIANSKKVLIMLESSSVPVYYFPREDVAMDFLERSDHGTFSQFKGEASYWNVNVGARTEENAVWSYETPFMEAVRAKNYMAFYWDRVDHWYEEDEEVFVHPRDPYKRVDIAASSRPVRVVLGGETIADTTSAHFLFETGMPTRFYIPKKDIKMDLLEPSDTTTRCPYKGSASYFSVRSGGELYEDMAWTYAEPILECANIKDLVCFYNENVDAVYLDELELPKPETKWLR
ncbi:MAG: DUF427 domain-containing protein [Rhodospirillales bacterium]|nr:DUF427 domain-containing protein [Rhodospirillales bacterium]